jgi:hypothetical protein
MGASLVQAWYTRQELGFPPAVCLISSEQTLASGKGISTLIPVSIDELVRLVFTVLNHSARESASLFIFNGRTGHVITGHSADPDGNGITFTDPWPGSLLSKAQNAMDVDAKQVNGEWHITSAELKRVLIAAFVSPATWAVLNGQPGRPTMTDLRKSYFGRSPVPIDVVARDDSDPTRVVITLRPYDFGEHGAMEIVHNEKNEIYSIVLRIRQSFTGIPPYDFNSSSAIVLYRLLTELVPQADKETMRPLADELRILHRMEFLAKAQRFEYRDSQIGRFAFAFLGVTEQDFGEFGTLSVLSISTITDSSHKPWTEITLTMH